MTERRPTHEEAAQRVEDVTALLESFDTMSLAICEADGPWIARAFFVEDEPEPGRLDLCCSLLLTTARRTSFDARPRVAFIVGGEAPDRWVTGRGTAELIEDEADAAAIVKRLRDRAAPAGPFLDGTDATAVRIHVERLTVTDHGADPPVTELTFA